MACNSCRNPVLAWRYRSLIPAICSTNVRRTHPVLSQKNQQTVSRMTVDRPATGRSEILRSYRLWTRFDGTPQVEHKRRGVRLNARTSTRQSSAVKPSIATPSMPGYSSCSIDRSVAPTTKSCPGGTIRHPRQPNPVHGSADRTKFKYRHHGRVPAARGTVLAREEYALSARTTSGRVRGRPTRRGMRSRAITSVKAGASPACPAVSTKARGRQLPSAARRIFVVSPPRERPMGVVSGLVGRSPLLRAPAAC